MVDLERFHFFRSADLGLTTLGGEISQIMWSFTAGGVLPIHCNNLGLTVDDRQQHVVNPIVAVNDGLRPGHGSLENLNELITNLSHHLGKIAAEVVRKHLQGGRNARLKNGVPPELI